MLINNSNIEDVKFQGNDAMALYFGNTLIWEREEFPEGATLRIEFDKSKIGTYYKDEYGVIASGFGKYSNSENLYLKSYEIGINAFRQSQGNEYKFNMEKITPMLSKKEYIPPYSYYFGANGSSKCYHLTKVLELPNEDVIPLSIKGFIYLDELEYINLKNITKPFVQETNSNRMFICNNKELVEVEFGNFDCSDLERYFLKDCPKLVKIRGNLYNFGLGYASNLIYTIPEKLDKDSIMVLFKGFADMNGHKEVSILSSQYSQLTEEEIAIATSKGWTVLVK